MEDRTRDAIQQRLTEMVMERQIADGLAQRTGHLRADRETAGAMQRFRALVDLLLRAGSG